ncbi:MAG: tRNA (adenosine(37)-N6)-dimethylallyltransferase MiaA [Deltaproteobacteria bacterium]|nr:tRNA (adenosine(37)-N6)-dimethylallyltransferase MiaA [Deltaproteobacteria bacterium]
MSNPPRRVLVFTGPTGSGKSDVGLELAEALGAEIVSADSVQVYRHFDIGSAKPRPSELARVPHHLISVLEPSESFSAGAFRTQAITCIDEILARGKVPLILGGPGLYIQALLAGIVPTPTIDDAAKSQLQALEDQIRIESGNDEAQFRVALHRLLVEADPEAGQRIEPGDLQRTRRALLVQYSGKIPLSALQASHQYKDVQFSALVVGMFRDRVELYRRIDERTDRMMADGFVPEVCSLLEQFGDMSPALGSLGYRHVARHLRGELDLPECITEIQRDTRRFAKRQLTWWRNQPRKLGWEILPEMHASGAPPEIACSLHEVTRSFLSRSGAFADEKVFFLPLSA